MLQSTYQSCSQGYVSMITWMQKHKKWLIITIWISVIAFVGAVMVNWGSYGFGLSNDKVAKVGDMYIHMPDYQMAYNQTLREYSNLPQLAGVLDEAQAKQLGIPQIALERVIQQTKILNFAKDLGFAVSDEEVRAEILKAKDMYADKDGNFSEDIYKSMLKERQMSVNEFEENVRKSLLMQKLFSVMNMGDAFSMPSLFVAPLEKVALKRAYSISDRLMIKIIPASQAKVAIDDKELFEFWETNANNWKTPMEFDIEYILVSVDSQQHPEPETLKEHYDNFKGDYLDENGHLMSMEQSMHKLVFDVKKVEAEKIAKREYRDLKNGTKTGILRTIKDGEHFFIKNGVDFVIEDMKVAQDGQVLKPIEVDDGFVTLRLVGKRESVNMSFEEAKKDARRLYERNKTREALAKLAEESLKDFSGTDIGFVDRFYSGNVLTLDDNQRTRLINHIFTSQKIDDYVLFDDKVVLYRILEQSENRKQIEEQLSFFAADIKFQAILDALVEYLDKTYKTTVYIDVSK